MRTSKLFIAAIVFTMFCVASTAHSQGERTAKVSMEWTAKNLDVGVFANGEAIPEAKTPEQWQAAGREKKPAWCHYENDPSNGATYGKLYNWYAIMDPRGIAPNGWHIPSKEEWEKLAGYLGGGELNAGSRIAGDRLREKGTAHWPAPNTGATDEIGFTGLPGGWRSPGGSFSGKGFGAVFWTSTTSGRSTDDAYYMQLHESPPLTPDVAPKGGGYSVRLVKD